MALTLMKGSEAIARSRYSCRRSLFLRLPHHSRKTEIPEYMSARMPEIGGCFLQAESEVAAINMVYGAAVYRRPRHHLLLQPRRVPEAGRYLLLRRRHRFPLSSST